VTFKGDSLASYAYKGGSGKTLSRKFCRKCGSSLASEAEVLPIALILKAGTLDDTSWVKPAFHIWTDSAQPWVHIDPAATKFAKARQ